MSTANISEDIRVKFPLHSTVWENDYRKLEHLLSSTQVGKKKKKTAEEAVNLHTHAQLAGLNREWVAESPQADSQRRPVLFTDAPQAPKYTWRWVT